MNQMRVRIDKSRQDNPASDVQRLSRPRCGQGLYLGACTYGDDAAVANQKRSVFEESETGKRFSASRSAPP